MTVTLDDIRAAAGRIERQGQQHEANAPQQQPDVKIVVLAHPDAWVVAEVP